MCVLVDVGLVDPASAEGVLEADLGTAITAAALDLPSTLQPYLHLVDLPILLS